MKKILIFLLLAAIFVLPACKKTTEDPHAVTLSQGVFIVNQGVFNAGNASLTYFDTQSGEVSQQLFFAVNGSSLGDVAQSINVQNDVSYIVVNNSGLIYCIDNKHAEVQGKISGLTSPRNILIVNDQKAYVSDLYDQKITIVNPTSYEIKGTIEVGRSSEEMVLVGDRAFVANYSAFNQQLPNNVVMMIDTNTDQLNDTIKVGIEPNSMVKDKNDNVWVLCSGGYDNQEYPTLWKINGADGTVMSTFTFPVLESSPSSLKVNGEGDQLYFLNGGVYSMSVEAASLPEKELIVPGQGRFFGYLGVDPQNGDIYVGDPKDYQSFAVVYRYSSDGQSISTIDAGFVPGAFGFNY